MDPPPPAPSPPSRPPDGPAAPGAPATAGAASCKEAPVTDTTDSTQADAQGGLHHAAISNPENGNEAAISTQGDSPRNSEAHLGDSSVQTTSKQSVNSDGTRKRNFQPGNKESVHVPSAGSKSHAREISVVETKDARSKFLKKSDNEDPACEEGKNSDLAGISEELKENNNRSSLNSSSLKDEKRQKNRSRGKENSNHVHNTSTSHDLSLPTSTGTSGLTSMVTENHTEAPKCTGLRLKKNPDEVSLTNSFTVVNAEITDGGNLNVDSTIQKNRDEVLPGSLKEKETENVATSLGSCVLDSSQLASRNVSLMPLQSVIVHADVKTNCLHSSTGKKVYQSAVSEDVTIPSDLVSQPNISEERKNFGSGKHTREAILRTSFNSAGIEKVLPSENQKNQSYPFNEGANFFQTGNTDPNFRADVHHRRNVYGSGGMGNSEYEFQRNQTHPFSEGGNFFQLGRADPNLRAGVHHSMDMYGSGGMGNSEYGFQRNRSHPFSEGANFFQTGNTDPNFRADVHHRRNIYGSGGMGNSEYGLQRNRSYPFDEGANFFQLGRADPNFRAGAHHNMNIYVSGAMGNSEHGFQRNQSYPFNEGANFFQLGRADPNFRAGVHHNMSIYGSGAMGNSEHGFQRNQSYPFDEGANFFQLGRADPNFRAGVHHNMNIYGSGSMGNPEHGFQRNHSYPFDEGADFFQRGRADPNFRAGVHHSMNIYETRAMGSSEHGFQRNQSYPFNEGANFFELGRADPSFREGVHHSMNMYGSDAKGNSEHGFGRSYLDHTSTERNEMHEKERTCLSTKHNNDRISPSNLAEAYSEKLRMSFPPRDSLIGFRKKKLLILDLNGLLADINEDFHNAHMADAKVRRKLVFRRPYCDDFLNFCIKNFELGVWSSRKRKNVDSVVDILMSDFKPYLLFSWARDKCTMTGRNTLENVHKPIVLKELRKLWKKEEPGLPWKEGEFSPSNTLLVDDSPYKALRNPPHTAIFPQPFSYLNRNDNSLGPGGDLRMYLEKLVFADDVECYVRNNPFGQPFITQSDPNWNFYAEIAGKEHEGKLHVCCISDLQLILPWVMGNVGASKRRTPLHSASTPELQTLVAAPPPPGKRRDGVRLWRVRQARGGGRPPPHARPPGVDRRQGAAQRAARGGGPLRGDLHVRRPRPPEDEVPPLPPQEDEHQALPRPHPLPRPGQDPLAHHPRYDSAQDREGRGRARQAQGVRGRAAAIRQDQAHGHPRRTQGSEAAAWSQVLPPRPALEGGRMELRRHHQGAGGEEEGEGKGLIRQEKATGEAPRQGREGSRGEVGNSAGDPCPDQILRESRAFVRHQFWENLCPPCLE